MSKKYYEAAAALVPGMCDQQAGYSKDQIDGAARAMCVVFGIKNHKAVRLHLHAQCEKYERRKTFLDDDKLARPLRSTEIGADTIVLA